MHFKPAFRPQTREQGVALILVLAFLVILSAVVLSFFSGVTTELTSAKNSQASVSARQLAESATNLVMSQIADATAGYKDPNDSKSDELAWASQPGMIRTYDQNGDPYRYYKLYSSRNLVMQGIPSANYNIVKEEFTRDVPANWHEQPAAYVDLNAPVRTTPKAKGEATSYEYPIVNPAAQKSSAGAEDGVEGFEIIDPPGFDGRGTRPTPEYDPTSRPEANPAPMPVRWIYVLQDGTLTAAPDPGEDGTLVWQETGDLRSSPTKQNPIVGRIAFWADDDTAKVNINTASEGVFWDRPWSKSGKGNTEAKFAAFIPVQNEFQRYPGHPAMTSLSPILGWFLPYGSVTDRARYYELAPRVVDGGTLGGTEKASVPLAWDHDRLFASVDEVVFAPVRASDSPSTPRQPLISFETAGNTPAREALNRIRFFLTANSRAPEVNIFNKPRIGLWPIQMDPKLRDAIDRPSGTQLPRNAKDKLLAFSTQSGPADDPAIYHFQRYSEYLFNNIRVYGDGRQSFLRPTSQPSSTSPVMDWEKIERNRELYAYLQKLTETDIPGFGGHFKAKYDAHLPANVSLPDGEVKSYSDRDQILTQMMDYVRTNVNSYSSASTMTPQYDFSPTRRGGPAAGEAQLVPLRLPNQTKGFGRFPTVTEAAIVLYRQQSGVANLLRAFVILELYNPTPGLPVWSPHVCYEIAGLDGIHPRTGQTSNSFRVSGAAFGNTPTSLNWPRSKTLADRDGSTRRAWPWNLVTSRVGYGGGSGHGMAFMGAYASFLYFNPAGNPDHKKVPGISGMEGDYPFYTLDHNPAAGQSAAVITNPAGTFDFLGGDLEIRLYSGFDQVSWTSRAPRAKNLVQTIRMNFPPIAGLPLPIGNSSIDARLKAGQASLISVLDTVRSVEARHDGAAGGDLRMQSALPVVPEGYFTPHFKYATSSVRIAHSLRSEENNNTRNPPVAGTTPYKSDEGTAALTLVANTSYNRPPAAARGVTEARNVAGLGDFDNATGDGEDGAYVNKADEGNLATENGGYFSRGSFTVESGGTFSPNRQISSAVAFGSLPTGIKATEAAVATGNLSLARPWQTLLFTANPASRTGATRFGASGSGKHPGFGTIRITPDNPGGAMNQPPYVTPPDHLFLDLFTMPIVEPYAISEPFSTAGKVNLNYQIAPFTYIKRATALHAVLRSTKLTAIPTDSADKGDLERHDISLSIGGADGGKLDGTQRGTLYGFWQKLYQQGDLFRSASQICDISLIPDGKDVQYERAHEFWAQHKRTGDNVREIPYGHIYPRVTTKSNTYTVHMRVQSLRKARNSPPDQWTEGRDQVLSEYRGSTTLERYIDPASPRLPDFAAPAQSATDNLDRHYQFRVIATKAFAP